jgi:hypothetical protein
MKRLAVAAALVAALALPSLALAGGPPAGKYTTRITTPPELKGTWAISFASGGKYTIRQNGTVVVRGHYLAVAPQIEFGKETGSKACPAVGYYDWKRRGKALTFHKLSDPKCAGRAFVLGHPFTLAV